METELRGQMTDKEFREQFREWALVRHKVGALVSITCDPNLGPLEVIAGPGDEALMGAVAYAKLNSLATKMADSN